ncbi:HprK-related kinase A [Rubrivivax rivuli]|nr:HprK-related kinase A [Rubrivivax rivuli]
MAADAAPPNLGTAGLQPIRQALGGDGLWLDVGLVRMRVRSNLPVLAAHLQSVYRHFGFQTQGEWADLHFDLRSPGNLRRWIAPQVRFFCDGQVPFEPFPASAALPLMEWGANWLIGRRCNHLLLLHAGVVERQGRALVMPALPGSGKSTLTAALSLSGWRLLSDEFGAYDLAAGAFRPAIKPIGLKNQSIDVIRAFAPSAPLGPSFPKTRKGTVAHLAPDQASVLGVHETARPGAVLLPRWEAGSATQLQRVQPHLAFSALAFNAFNYQVLGAQGFQAVVALCEQCPVWQLVYSDLDDALARIDALWSEVMAGHSP